MAITSVRLGKHSRQSFSCAGWGGRSNDFSKPGLPRIPGTGGGHPLGSAVAPARPVPAGGELRVLWVCTSLVPIFVVVRDRGRLCLCARHRADAAVAQGISLAGLGRMLKPARGIQIFSFLLLLLLAKMVNQIRVTIIQIN